MLTHPYIMFDGESAGGATPPANPSSGSSNPPANPPAAPPAGEQSEVEKAYAKLREAERERDQLKGTVAQYEREKLPEAERVKAERDTEKQRADAAEQKLADHILRASVTEAARKAGFRAPSVATDLLMFRQVDLGSDAKIKSALDSLAQEDSGLVNGAPPSGGPINPQTGNPAPGEAGFNSIIRSAAGRR